MTANTSSPVLLAPETEQLIKTYNKISGPTFAVINVTVFILIIFDPDNRHTTYRRYLLVLQFICMCTDGFVSLMSPVVLATHWVIYSTGIMPFGLTVKIAIIIYCLLIIEIAMAYAACALYCHQVILPKESPFRLKRWFLPFIALLNAWCLVYFPGIYYAIDILQYSYDEIPLELRWVTSKQYYYVFHWDNDAVWIIAGGGFFFCLPVYTIACIVFFHMFYIIRTGMGHVSPATRQTQVRAAISIALQITIPCCCLVGPLGYQLGALLLRTDWLPVGEIIRMAQLIFSFPF